MNKKTTVFVVGLALLVAGCTAAEPEVSQSPEAPPVTPSESEAPTVTAEDGQLITETIATPSLANNMLGDPAERDILVFLPPSYDASGTRYPVVYFLAGYSQRVGTFRSYQDTIWEQMLAEDAQEFILVEVDGRSVLGGNYYANSPVSGNAEDCLTQDVISYIDTTYRTIPEASGRGLSGFSMGGSGTVNVGLAHPELYAALYAASPGLLHEEGGLAAFLLSNGNWVPYGATFVPNVDGERPYFHPILPRVPLEEQDPELVAAWEAGYGDLRAKIADYLARTERFEEIRIAYGTQDGYPWIPEGSAWFVDLLEENDIPVSERVFEGSHTLDSVFFQSDFVDFFSRTLSAGGVDAG